MTKQELNTIEKLYVWLNKNWPYNNNIILPNDISVSDAWKLGYRFALENIRLYEKQQDD